MLLVPCVTEQISFTGLIFEVSESLNGFIFRPFNCGRSLLSCLKGVVFAAAPLGLHMLFRMWAFFLRCRIIVLYQRWHWFIASPVSTSGWKSNSWLRFILQSVIAEKAQKAPVCLFFSFCAIKNDASCKCKNFCWHHCRRTQPDIRAFICLPEFQFTLNFSLTIWAGTGV